MAPAITQPIVGFVVAQPVVEIFVVVGVPEAQPTVEVFVAQLEGVEVLIVESIPGRGD